MSKRRLLWFAIAVGITSGLIFFLSDRSDPQVIRALELQHRLAEEGPNPSSTWDEFQELIASLSDEQLAQLREASDRQHTEQLRAFFSLSPEEQVQKLDLVIDARDASLKLTKATAVNRRAATARKAEPAVRAVAPSTSASSGKSLSPEDRELRFRYMKALLDRRVARSGTVRR